MPLQVSRMKEEDIDGAIDTIQQAFADDPYNNWQYSDRSNYNPTRNRASLTLRCKWGIAHALFHVCKDSSSSTPDKVLGTAMWMPPRDTATPETWSLYLSYWWLWFHQGLMNLRYGRGGLNVKRYWLWKEAQSKAQEALWDDPKGYYFCNIVTVLPEAQGMGVGRALMNEVLEQADKEGRKCYLESSRSDPNVKIYEKFGFRLVRDMPVDDNGDAITLYCMVRDPRPSQETGAVANGAAA